MLGLLIELFLLFPCLLQLKNVDFEGLFGNIGGVISLSQRLLETLQDTDSIGERPRPLLCRLSFSKGALCTLF